MATFVLKDNLVVIKSKDASSCVVLQKEHIVGYQFSNSPDILSIILTNNTVSIKITEADGWSDVINGLTTLITCVKIAPRLIPV